VAFDFIDTALASDRYLGIQGGEAVAFPFGRERECNSREVV